MRSLIALATLDQMVNDGFYQSCSSAIIGVLEHRFPINLACVLRTSAANVDEAPSISKARGAKVHGSFGTWSVSVRLYAERRDRSNELILPLCPA